MRPYERVIAVGWGMVLGTIGVAGFTAGLVPGLFALGFAVVSGTCVYRELLEGIPGEK